MCFLFRHYTFLFIHNIICYVLTVPAIPNDSNRILVVGSIMGQIGVVTWNGYDTHQQSRQNEEGNNILWWYLRLKEIYVNFYEFTVCKHIWWGHTHDGPINCIKRNVFYPDIHLVCGGHIVSIWSLNYKVNIRRKIIIIYIIKRL